MYNCTLQQAITTYQAKKGESNFQSYHITILKMSSFQKNKTYEIGKYAVFTGKKKKLTEIVSEGGQSLDVGVLEYSIIIKRNLCWLLLEISCLLLVLYCIIYMINILYYIYDKYLVEITISGKMISLYLQKIKIEKILPLDLVLKTYTLSLFY